MSSKQPPVCPKCGDTLPSEHALRLHAFHDFVHCQGKCEECNTSGNSCDLTRSTGPCSNCRSSGTPCKVPKRYNRYKVKQCTRCLCRFGPQPHSTEDCIGRCVHCVENDLPCRLKHRRPKQSNDCIFCLQERKECIRPHTEDPVLAEDEMGESSK